MYKGRDENIYLFAVYFFHNSTADKWLYVLTYTCTSDRHKYGRPDDDKLSIVEEEKRLSHASQMKQVTKSVPKHDITK